MKRERTVTERCRLAAQFEEVKETDAGWTFQMWAQYYGIVNDRPWIFHAGSFAKTIRERVGSNQVKIHDGHNWEMTATDTIGRVLSAEETAKGCRYKGFLNRSHSSIASKLADGTVSENSVEIFRMKSETVEVGLDQVPDHVRPWVEITTNGKARILAIKEVKWLAVGLVSGSAQDRKATISPPIVVGYQDIPITLSRWDAGAARERILAYARHGSVTDYAALSRAHLIQLSTGECLGQIGDIDPDGRLTISRGALDEALNEVRSALPDRLDSRRAVQEAVDAAAETVAAYSRRADLTASPVCAYPQEGVIAPPVPSDGAEPQADTRLGPSASSTHSRNDGNTTAERSLSGLLQRVRLLGLRQRSEEGVRSEPARPSGESTAARASGLAGDRRPGDRASGAP